MIQLYVSIGGCRSLFLLASENLGFIVGRYLYFKWYAGNTSVTWAFKLVVYIHQWIHEICKFVHRKWGHLSTLKTKALGLANDGMFLCVRGYVLGMRLRGWFCRYGIGTVCYRSVIFVCVWVCGSCICMWDNVQKLVVMLIFDGCVCVYFYFLAWCWA